MVRTFGLLLGIAACFAAFAGRPCLLPAQTTAPALRTASISDTSAATMLARQAIKQFFPSVLTDTTDPGVLFVVVGPDGKLLNATHGTLDDNDKLKGQYESYEEKVASMAIKIIPAGAIVPRALEVVITTFK